MRWRNWRDQFGLILAVIVLCLVALNGRLGLGLAGEVVGGLMALLTLIVQFYYRKAGGDQT